MCLPERLKVCKIPEWLAAASGQHDCPAPSCSNLLCQTVCCVSVARGVVLCSRRESAL
jgi:hypothetical protein